MSNPRLNDLFHDGSCDPDFFELLVRAVSMRDNLLGRTCKTSKLVIGMAYTNNRLKANEIVMEAPSLKR